jgi:sugar/nucleoside kinase (ribokinase family)
MNDAEIRQLTGLTNLWQAAAKVHEYGPEYVIVKKGEHGAVMYCNGRTCFMAAPYPLDEVADPTGAGDSFAGGFMGYIARTGEVTDDNLRRAVVYGSTLASYNVQDFSLNRFKRLTIKEVDQRYEEFRRIVHFDPVT